MLSLVVRPLSTYSSALILKEMGKSAPQPPSNLHHDFFGESGSAGHIFSVFIFTNVRKPRQKLIDQIPVGAVDLNQFKSCLIALGGRHRRIFAPAAGCRLPSKAPLRPGSWGKAGADGARGLRLMTLNDVCRPP